MRALVLLAFGVSLHASCGGRIDAGPDTAGIIGSSSGVSSGSSTGGATGSSTGVAAGSSSGTSAGGMVTEVPDADVVVLDATLLPDGACILSPAPQCAQNPSGQVVTTTLAAFTAAIAARWVLCGTESVFARNGGDAGLEITADGHWYKLYPAVGGGLVRGAGFDQEGTWDTVFVAQTTNDPQPFQLNLHIGSGTVITHPVLASTPRAMKLNNNGVFIGTYVDVNAAVGSTRCGG